MFQKYVNRVKWLVVHVHNLFSLLVLFVAPFGKPSSLDWGSSGTLFQAIPDTVYSASENTFEYSSDLVVV